jgi:small-conductance mechanosensitive channel
MRKIQKIAAVVVLILGGFTLYGYLKTQQVVSPDGTTGRQRAKPLIVLRGLKTAQQLAQIANTREERALAQEALRLADYDADLAFDEAIRDARLHPPPLSPEAAACMSRKEQAEKSLEAAQERAKRLAEELVKLPADKQAAIESELIQTEADMELAQDEVEDANHDLQMAGGDVVARLTAMRKLHEDASKVTQSATSPEQETIEQAGLMHRVVRWRSLHQKQMSLWQAKTEAETAEARLTARHNALDTQIETEKVNIATLSAGEKQSRTEPGGVQGSGAATRQIDAKEVLKKTEALANDQKIVEAFDKRIATKKELAGVYLQWIDLVAGYQRAVLHRALVEFAIILGIVLIGIFFTTWLDSLVRKVPMDRRQVESLRTVTRVTSQVIGLCLIALVVFGLPSQLGTFLGLAGAGLTVALKDFIVSFIGWFVLMGKNGIRLGDWVEINGVTGEVVQISPFHTVLLETGNWTDSGHPTGRRVTFTNSYAIEGHYFNFSTTGQWLWDELQVTLPGGQDPYPKVEALHQKVREATQESVKQAEEEWRKATTSHEMSGFSADPAISVRPVSGGVEMSVRYITRANERYEMRTKLYQAAIEVLGGIAPRPVPTPTPQGKTA